LLEKLVFQPAIDIRLCWIFRHAGKRYYYGI